jgi:hypothetical protein
MTDGIDRPILFSAPMVRALLAGTKTQTRRIVKPQPSLSSTEAFLGLDGIWRFSHPTARGPVSHEADDVRCPYGQPGDRLWVRETHYIIGEVGEVFYRATNDSSLSPPLQWHGRWKPSIHMPRAASRITLEVTGVRVERLQDISEEDAQAEGLIPLSDGSDRTWTVDGTARSEYETAREAYRHLWEDINGFGSWDSNPWVWAVEFKRLQP